jgi:hypothetical protein
VRRTAGEHTSWGRTGGGSDRNALTEGSIYVKESLVKGAGGGLFAGKRFRGGECITKYVGRRVPSRNLSREVMQRGYVVRSSSGYVDTHNASGRLRLRGGEVVDTHHYSQREWARLETVGVAWEGRGSLARFANHSNTPNARIKGLRILAKRDVIAGDEITVNYGPAYRRMYIGGSI